jgi:hypothetical protein
MLLDFEKSDSPRERAWLRRKLTKAYETRDANATLLSQSEQQRQQALQKAKRTVLAGDRKMISRDKMIRRWAEQQISKMTPQIAKEQQARRQRALQAQKVQQAQQAQQADSGPSTLVSNDDPYTLLERHDAHTTPSRPQAMHFPDAAEPSISRSGSTSRFLDPSAPLVASNELSPPPPQSSFSTASSVSSFSTTSILCTIIFLLA